MHNPAATFFMRVTGDAAADAAVQPDDLLVVDRSQAAQHQSLVVGIIEGQLVVLRVQKQGRQLRPLADLNVRSWEVWGVVTHIIRKV